MKEKELWRNVIGFEGEYIVSNQGRVMRLPCMRKTAGEDNYIVHPGRVLTPVHDRDGYLEVKFRRNGERINKKIHRLVVEAFILESDNWMGRATDHIDRNKQNNVPSNLRPVTNLENMQNVGPRKQGKNSSQYLGVRYCDRTNKYSARIYINGKRKTLGSFADEIQAAIAYQKARELKKQQKPPKQTQQPNIL